MQNPAGSRMISDASIEGEELTDYAIRNLGFVAAKDLNGSLRISLRPSVVSPIAFSALMYWLHDRSADRVLISYCDRESTHEMTRSRDEAVRKLMSRVDFGQGARDGDFLQEDLPLDGLPQTSPLWDVLEAWRASGGNSIANGWPPCWSARSTAASSWWRPRPSVLPW